MMWMRRLACLVLIGCGGSSPPPPVLSGTHPDDRPTHVHILTDYSSFQSTHREYDLTLRGDAYVANGQGATTTKGRSIDARLVDAIAAAQTDLRPSDGIYECSSHTDDYRVFRIVAEGSRPYTVEARSNCTRMIPWHVVRDGALHVQYTGALGIAVSRLLAGVDPEHHEGPGPDLFRAAPRGGVLMGNYSNFDDKPYASTSEPIAGVRLAPSLIAACAKSIENSTVLRDAVGESVHVVMMNLGCDLETDPTCHRADADATFDIGPATITYALPCVDGELRLADKERDTFATLRAFLTSKPVRVALGKRTGKASLIPEGPGSWKLWIDDTELFTLEVSVVKRTIDVSSYVGPASTKFWTDLGIDVKTVTKKDPSYRDSTIGKLDFDGHLVP